MSAPKGPAQGPELSVVDSPAAVAPGPGFSAASTAAERVRLRGIWASLSTAGGAANCVRLRGTWASHRPARGAAVCASLSGAWAGKYLRSPALATHHLVFGQ